MNIDVNYQFVYIVLFASQLGNLFTFQRHPIYNENKINRFKWFNNVYVDDRHHTHLPHSQKISSVWRISINIGCDPTLLRAKKCACEKCLKQSPSAKKWRTRCCCWCRFTEFYTERKFDITCFINEALRKLIDFSIVEIWFEDFEIKDRSFSPYRDFEFDHITYNHKYNALSLAGIRFELINLVYHAQKCIFRWESSSEELSNKWSLLWPKRR